MLISAVCNSNNTTWLMVNAITADIVIAVVVIYSDVERYIGL